MEAGRRVEWTGECQGCGREVEEGSWKNCRKETAADRFVKPPRRKETRRVVPRYIAHRVFLLDVLAATATAAAAARAKVRVSHACVYGTCRVHMRRDAAMTVRIRALFFDRE